MTSVYEYSTEKRERVYNLVLQRAEMLISSVRSSTVHVQLAMFV